MYFIMYTHHLFAIGYNLSEQALFCMDYLNKVAEMGWLLPYQINGYILINFIEWRSLQYYAYNAEGSGCLMWTKHIIKEL